MKLVSPISAYVASLPEVQVQAEKFALKEYGWAVTAATTIVMGVWVFRMTRKLNRSLAREQRSLAEKKEIFNEVEAQFSKVLAYLRKLPECIAGELPERPDLTACLEKASAVAGPVLRLKVVRFGELVSRELRSNTHILSAALSFKGVKAKVGSSQAFEELERIFSEEFKSVQASMRQELHGDPK